MKCKLGYDIQFLGILEPIYPQQLTESELSDYDYYSEEELAEEVILYVLYRKDGTRQIFDLGNFMRSEGEWYHGAWGQSYFDGYVIKYKVLIGENEEVPLLYRIYC